MTVPGTTPTTSTDTIDKAAGPSIGQLAADASTHLSTIIRGEVELAKTELKVSVKNAGVGIVLFVVAGVLLIYGLTFGLIALAEGLVSLGLWRWAAFLVVFGILVLVAAVLGFVGFRKVKKVKAPERTITTGKDTVAFLKHPTQA